MEQNTKPTGDLAVASSDLLGCPFCGVIPEYEARAKCESTGYHWPHQVVHDCEIVGFQICIRAHKAGLPDTKESVFSIWNTRAAGHPNSAMSRDQKNL